MKRHIQNAFTLIELMTATGLTVVMLLLMAGLYSQTADIIRAGIATSDNIERSRAATRELVGIFDYMVPPTAIYSNGQFVSFDATNNSAGRSISDNSVPGGGMLVITNKIWSARGMFGPGSNPDSSNLQDWFPIVNSKRMGFTPDDIRSDMVSFFVFNRLQSGSGQPLNLSTITPIGMEYFAGNKVAEAEATVAKVWIGHLQLVNRDGSPKTSHTPMGVYDDDENPVKDSFGVTTANEWVLGMQYMLTGMANGPAVGSAHSKTMLDTDIGDMLEGYSDYGAVASNDNSDEAAFLAVSDIAAYSFLNPEDASTSNRLAGRVIVGNGSTATVGGGANAIKSLLKPNPAAITGTTDDTYDLTDTNAFANPSTTPSYKATALAMTYVNNRLQFNPAPSDDLFSYLVAQTHAGFLPYCAEIVVEFAADCDGDGLIDREGFTDLYTTSDKNTAPQTMMNGYGPEDQGVDINWNGIKDDGSIIWYGAYQSINSNGERMGPAMRPRWAIKSVSSAGGYLQMPDVRQNQYDLQFPFNNADYGFVWRHDYPDNWPYLLRIRLRLMSRSGVLEFDPREPQFDFKKRRLKLDIATTDPEHGMPKMPSDYTSFEVLDDYSSYDRRDISFGTDWNGSQFQDINDRLPGSWYEFIVPVRRQ